MEPLGDDSVFVVEDGHVPEKIYSRQEIEGLLQTKNPRIKLEQLKGSYSEVWRYIGVVLVDGKTTGFAACRNCTAKVFKYEQGGGVTHLRNHVKLYCASSSARTPTVNNNRRYLNNFKKNFIWTVSINNSALII